MMDGPTAADTLARLQQAQQRIESLKVAGADMTSQEARRAVNTLITQIRHASPEVLAAFNAWKAEQGFR
ncbi:MAG: hypothetical protein EXR52_02785 [Dehalococcoidia bacterium]|nr:hypothetical protein [Dehalococcoidia bacterium]